MFSFVQLFYRTIFLLLCGSIGLAAHAETIIPPEQAFALSVQADNQDIQVEWKVAPGYYLYQDRISFSSPKLGLGMPQFPIAEIKHDDILGTYKVLTNLVHVGLPYLQKSATNSALLYIGYQGCSNSGFCYPPQMKQVTLQFAKDGSVKTTIADYSGTAPPDNALSNLLQQHSHGWAILVFFGLGLLLAFTPCVLPMVPILSSIILGRGKLTTGKAFSLSLTYVLAMAITYAIAGVIAGLIGSTLQASLQSPWIIGLLVALFIFLAGAMFGFYDLRLPAKLENRLNQSAQHQRGGHYASVAAMGIISSLVVSPCISAPLVGALVYIGQTGNALLGGAALFSLAIGMGVPLLVLGTLGGKFLPRAGSWLDRSKHLAGFLMLGVAIWMLERIISGSATLAAWGTLAIIFAIYCFLSWPAKRFFAKALRGLISVIFLAYGIIAIIGAVQGHTDALQPLAKPVSQLKFIHVKSIADVEKNLAQAQGKYVLLDFYADWCVACKLMEKHVFGNPTIQRQLQDVVLLQADVTANDAVDKALEKQFNVYAPPTIILFDKNGKVVATINGEINAEEMDKQLAMLSSGQKSEN